MQQLDNMGTSPVLLTQQQQSFNTEKVAYEEVQPSEMEMFLGLHKINIWYEGHPTLLWPWHITISPNTYTFMNIMLAEREETQGVDVSILTFSYFYYVIFFSW